jgi:hypothetical protein
VALKLAWCHCRVSALHYWFKLMTVRFSSDYLLSHCRNYQIFFKIAATVMSLKHVLTFHVQLNVVLRVYKAGCIGIYLCNWVLVLIISRQYIYVYIYL